MSFGYRGWGRKGGYRARYRALSVIPYAGQTDTPKSSPTPKLIPTTTKDEPAGFSVMHQRRAAAEEVAQTTHPSHSRADVVRRFWARCQCGQCGQLGKCEHRSGETDLELIRKSKYWPKGGLWSDGHIGGTGGGRATRTNTSTRASDVNDPGISKLIH